MNAVAMPNVGTIGHVDPPWKGDCLTGLQHTLALGYTAQDVNVHVCAPDPQCPRCGAGKCVGHVIGAHYATVADNDYRDPLGKVAGSRSVATLTLTEIRRLVPKTNGPERMNTVESWMPWAAEHGFALVLEWKPDAHTDDAVAKAAWSRVATEAKATGCVVVAATIQCWAPGKLKGAAEAAQLARWEAAAKRRMRTVSGAGVPTLLLWRRGVSDDWLPLLSGIKGGPARKGVAQLGNGLGQVTKFGGSVAPGQVKAANAKVKKLGGSFPPKIKPASPPVVKPPVVVPPTPHTADGMAARVIALARLEVGTHEGRSGGHWNNIQKYAKIAGHANGFAWCATFVYAMAKLAGAASLFPNTAGCDQGADWFKKAGRWSEYPAVGAQVFFGVPRDLSHTGIVIDFNEETITTIEGNTNTSGSREGDGVYLKTHLRREARVVGYGYPKYAGGIVSADPAWAKPAPKPAPPVLSKPPTPTGPVSGPTAPRPVAGPPSLAGFRPRIDGVDISHWQSGAIDWFKAKAAGVQFAYHKATEHTSYRDPKYAQRRGECALSAVRFGAYHFARPGRSSGAAQARFFLAVALPRPGDLRPVLDLEDRGGLSDERLTAWVEQFVAEVVKATGKPPVIYTPFKLTRDVGCFLWMARYNNANALPKIPAPWDRWTIWQFSNGVFGRPNVVPGIGKCDINTLQPGFDLARLTL
jgi:GH25 family lysozyme M1 (1,4-beta-N-acetylmuramidase)